MIISNIIVKVKQQGKHLFHFVEDEAVVDENSGRVKGAVDLVSRGKQQCAGLWQACLSVRPFKAIYDRGRAGVDVRFRIYTYSGCFKTYVFGRSRASCRGRLILYIIYIERKCIKVGRDLYAGSLIHFSCLYSDAVVMNAVGNCHFNAHFFQA